jgi:hypothetical protein
LTALNSCFISVGVILLLIRKIDWIVFDFWLNCLELFGKSGVRGKLCWTLCGWDDKIVAIKSK